ncbi:uncharacterized protein [Henckelia pumila]|uniref:uncharacterized protein n=1 Tax=Henckelia pumila TaxID=405737 RepID=UPI003C6E5DE5
MKEDLYDITDAAYCKIFRTTLSGRELTWFNKLPSGSIANLEQLTDCFIHQFSINKKYPKTAAYVFTIIQKEGKSLRDYVRRFTHAVHEVLHMNHDLLAGTMQQNLRHRNLRAKIEKFIKRGHLENFVDKSRGEKRDDRHRDEQPKRDYQKRHDETGKQHERADENFPTRGVFTGITGGPSCGDSNNARKALLRTAKGTNNLSSPTSLPMYEIGTIQDGLSFSDKDLENPRGTYNDALIILAKISNFWVKKILVDSGSSTDIIFHDAFVKLGISNAHLTPVNTPLVGFFGEVFEALGEVTLPLSLGSYPKRSTKMVKFLVVKSSSAYNVILGRPSLNIFQAIGSTYHMKLKFPTPGGIGEAVRDNFLARDCHAVTQRSSSGNRKRQVSSEERAPKPEKILRENGIHLVDEEAERK